MRPLLIGMNNPVSDDPRHALYPHPPGCAGHRLWRMLCDAAAAAEQPEPTRREYLDGFERRNLVIGEWSRATAERAAGLVAQSLLSQDRDVVLLGRDVWRTFVRGKTTQPMDVMRLQNCRLHMIPHPSGRNLWYNDLGNRARVGDLLLRLLRGVPARA